STAGGFGSGSNRADASFRRRIIRTADHLSRHAGPPAPSLRPRRRPPSRTRPPRGGISNAEFSSRFPYVRPGRNVTARILRLADSARGAWPRRQLARFGVTRRTRVTKRGGFPYGRATAGLPSAKQHLN